MKIAFWSNARGRAGTTSNLACLSTVGALESPGRNILLENHCNLTNLGEAFIKKQWGGMVQEEIYYYSQIGLDSLLRRLHSKIFDMDMVKQASVPLLNQQMYYVPQSHITNKEFFEYELNQVIHRLFEVLEDFGEYVYIDTAGGGYLSTKLILEAADVVVVNLSQEQAVLDDYFEKYDSLDCKAVYLIGNYNADSKFNLSNITRKYRIKKDKIGVVPHNAELKDALSDGSLIKFITRNYTCGPEDENYYFMKQMKHASKVLKKRIAALGGEKIIA